jgi:import receptor subunit TOM20
VREETEALGAMQMESIRRAVAQAKDEGFPTDLEEKEAFFMGQVAKGEALCADSTLQVELERAFANFKTLIRCL